MSTTTNTHAAGDRTPAQVYSLVFGATLLLVGIIGFFVNSSFDTGSGIEGDKLILVEVNGWHNVVHLLSGLVLLAAFRRRGPAKAVAIAFGVVYGIVAIIGLVDGNDVLGIIPINAPDSVLHIALAVLGIVAGLASRGTDDDVRRHGEGRLLTERDRPASRSGARSASARR